MADRLAELEAENAELRQSLAVAEAVAAERGADLADLRAALAMFGEPRR